MYFTSTLPSWPSALWRRPERTKAKRRAGDEPFTHTVRFVVALEQKLPSDGMPASVFRILLATATASVMGLHTQRRRRATVASVACKQPTSGKE
ncbi:hypothetical protein VTH06DRAFT_5078 [Thermothelomyces fergusii]